MVAFLNQAKAIFFTPPRPLLFSSPINPKPPYSPLDFTMEADEASAPPPPPWMQNKSATAIEASSGLLFRRGLPPLRLLPCAPLVPRPPRSTCPSACSAGLRFSRRGSSCSPWATTSMTRMTGSEPSTTTCSSGSAPPRMSSRPCGRRRRLPGGGRRRRLGTGSKWNASVRLVANACRSASREGGAWTASGLVGRIGEWDFCL
jgi:hypothetical protein